MDFGRGPSKERPIKVGKQGQRHNKRIQGNRAIAHFQRMKDVVVAIKQDSENIAAENTDFAVSTVVVIGTRIILNIWEAVVENV